MRQKQQILLVLPFVEEGSRLHEGLTVLNKDVDKSNVQVREVHEL